MEYAARIYRGISLGLGGNRCFHNPLSPNFYIPPEQHGYRPEVIQLAGKRLKNFYFDPYSYLQSLNYSRKSTRKERSEARERDVIVLGILLHYTELSTMRVGTPLANGTFLPPIIIEIAIKAGWREQGETGNRGIKRVWRALKSLERAGYITVYRRWKRGVDGEKEYIGLPAVRCIAPKLFYELGVKAMDLNKARKRAYAQLKKKYIAFREEAEAELKKITQQVIGAMGSVFRGTTPKKRGNQRELHAMKVMEERLRAKEQELKAHLMELMKIPINHQKSREALIKEYPELKELPLLEKALKRA